VPRPKPVPTAPPLAPAAALRALVRIHREYGPGLAARKGALLARLAGARLATAREVLRLHECLAFLRAYPDDRAVLARVEAMMAAFAERADLRRHARALENSGLAGTVTRFRFFEPTARWLARAWPDRLRVDWDAWGAGAADLDHVLPALALWAETPALDEWDLGTRAWIERLKGPNETDGTFLVRRFAGAFGPLAELREKVWDRIEPPLLLEPGPGGPSRTRAFHPRAPRALQRGALRRGRPDLAAALAQPPRAVRALSPVEGERVIALAREAMVARSRDLDAFSHGDPRDVRMVDVGDGYAFAAIGVKPEKRLLLEAVYAFLTLKNGVPIGYVLNSALCHSAEIAYNVFETYRGAEAGVVYGRVLATVRHLFGCDHFTIYPYQLGQDNAEAIASGAWWFYQKLGFRPRDPGAIALMERELARMRRNPRHRSARATLVALADHNLFFASGPPRDDVMGVLPFAQVGGAVSAMLARRFGADRERGARECEAEALGLLGLASLRGWSAGERLAFERWAPLVTLLPGIGGWSAAERAAAADVIRAKGGRRESDFVWRFDEHARLRAAVTALAQGDAGA